MSRPANLLADLGVLSWPTVLLGYRRRWMSAEDVAAAAVSALGLQQAGVSSNLALLALAEELTDREIEDSLVQLVGEDRDQVPDQILLRRWMLGHLVEVEQSNASDAEKLDRLEELYAEFGFPEELRYVSKYNTTSAERERQPHTGDQLGSPLAAMREAIAKLRADVTSTQARRGD